MNRDKYITNRDILKFMKIQPSELEYISNPDIWVSMLCPIKRRAVGHQPPETAYLFSDRPIIRHGNIWDPKPTDREEVFSSHAAIIMAGWIVD